MRSCWVVVCLWAAVGVDVTWAGSRGLFPRHLDRPDRIVGGAPVKKGEFLWQVSIQTNSRHFCGGTLIAPNLVVTAAHCVEHDFLLEDLMVVTGAWNLDERSSQRRHHVLFITRGPYDADSLQNDIALMWIAEEKGTARNKELPRGVPIAMETRKDRNSGESCLISGWGRLSSGGKLTPVMMAADVEIRSDEECQQMFAQHTYYNVFPSNLCAGGEAEDACQGDSGGPLVCCTGDSTDPTKCALAGITSWGIGCASKGIPGVYTEVAYHTEWIKEAVKERDTHTKGSTDLSFYGEDKEVEVLVHED